MVIPTKLASTKCIAVFFCFFVYCLFCIYLFIYLLICFFYCLFNWSTEMAVLTFTCFFYAEQSKDVFSSEIHNMLNGPGWSRRDHADWYTIRPMMIERQFCSHSKSICTSKCICYAKI